MSAPSGHNRTFRSLGVAMLAALVVAGCAPAGTVPAPTISAPPASSSPTGSPAPGSADPGSADPGSAAPGSAAPGSAPAAAVPAPGPPPTEVARSDFGALAAVRTGRHPGFDRVVFEFAQTVPGYRVRYVTLPVRADPSGITVPLPGATAALEVVCSPASETDGRGTPAVRTYSGPTRIAGLATEQVTELAEVGDVAAVLTWAVGVRARVPFTVTTLAEPPRLVIELAHRRG